MLEWNSDHEALGDDPSLIFVILTSLFQLCFLIIMFISFKSCMSCEKLWLKHCMPFISCDWILWSKHLVNNHCDFVIGGQVIWEQKGNTKEYVILRVYQFFGEWKKARPLKGKAVRGKPQHGNCLPMVAWNVTWTQLFWEWE